MIRPARLTIALLALTASVCASADSPVTSTPFSDAYMDYPIVRTAGASGVMSRQIARYLGSSAPLDVKAAVVNALSWKFEGKQNAKLYCEMRYRRGWESLRLEALSGDELLVLGYLLAMDDYSEVERALPFLAAARDKLPASHTVAMIEAIVRGQASFGQENDRIWERVERVLADDSLNGDLRIGANRIIVDYMILYRDRDPED